MGDYKSYARVVAKLIINEVRRYWKHPRSEPCPFPAEFIASVAYNLDEGIISHTQAKNYIKRFIDDTNYREAVHLILEILKEQDRLELEV